MKCRESQYWLYSFQPNAAWPADVVAHLQGCSTCQQLQGQLRQIDQGINELTSLPANEAPVAQLLSRIEEIPQAQPTTIAPPRQPAAWLRYGAYLTGAAALIAFGWLIGRLVEPVETIKTVEVVREMPVEVIREKTVEIFRDKLVPAHSQSDRSLFAALVKRNAQLVQTSQSEDRIETLLNMADDCRQHALALIANGPRDALPLTVDQYAQLLRDGVLVQLAQAPELDQPTLKTAVKTRLLRMADADAPATPVKILADQREALQTATQQTMERLDQLEGVNVPVRSKKVQRHEPMPPTSALIQFALTFSSETDPVMKADLCTDYVQRLMPSMMLYLADDAAPQRDEMGQQFGEMIQFGIYRPLQVATAKQPPQSMKAQADRIFQNAAQTVADMEKHLEQASEGMRFGFEKGVGKSNPESKGKSPPTKEGGKGPRTIHGVLKSVNGANSTITVTTKVQGKEAESTYALTKDILSAIGAKAFKLGDLKTGMELNLRLSEDRRMVIDINQGRGSNEKGQKENK
jgi:hypothetical protein